MVQVKDSAKKNPQWMIQIDATDLKQLEQSVSLPAAISKSCL